MGSVGVTSVGRAYSDDETTNGRKRRIGSGEKEGRYRAFPLSHLDEIRGGGVGVGRDFRPSPPCVHCDPRDWEVTVLWIHSPVPSSATECNANRNATAVSDSEQSSVRPV